MIPNAVRKDLAGDTFMLRCIHAGLEGASPCSGRVEWEHAFVYAGKQIQERWAIVPCCTYHHRGAGLDKNFNRFMALARMTQDERREAYVKYPRTDWTQMRTHLAQQFGGRLRITLTTL